MAYIVIGLKAAFLNINDRLIIQLEFADYGCHIITCDSSCASCNNHVEVTIDYLEGILDNVS